MDSSADGASAGDDSDVLALELDQLITDYFEAQREGRAPSVDEFVAQHPLHEHALRAVLPGANLLDQIGKRAEDATPQSRSGDKLGEYKLLGVLGRGGMGVVYEAVQETLGRPVALKVLPASRVVDRKSRERFMREAQAAASLQHPGIVPVYGVGEADGQVYYAMQRVDGVPLDVLTAAVRGDADSADSSVLIERAAGLAARLRVGGSSSTNGSSGAVSVREASGEPHATTRPWIANAVRVAHQIAEALSYAHSRGVLHRDIKPSNVMLDESGRAYVTDFGLCKTADTSSLTAVGDVVGTLRYVPPERFQGRDDARGDVYGVGMILYELLCSRPAFPQKDRATLVQAVTLQAPPRPRKINPDVPEDLERIVLTAIAKLPEERYSSAESLISDLTAYMEGRPIRARAPGKLYLARLFARRNKVLVATVAAFGVLIALGTALYVRNLGSLVREVEAGRATAERVSYHARLNAAVEAAGSTIKGLERSRRFLSQIDPASRDWLWETLYARTDTTLQIVDAETASAIDAALDSEQHHIAVLRDGSVRVHDARDGTFRYEAPSVAGTAVAFVPGSLDLVVVESEVHEGLLRCVSAPGRPADPVSEQLEAHLGQNAFRDVLDVDTQGGRIAVLERDGRILVLDRAHPELPIIHHGTPGASFVELFGGDGRVVQVVRRKSALVFGPAAGDERTVRGGFSKGIVDVSGSSSSDTFAALTASGYVVLFRDSGDGSEVPNGESLLRSSAAKYVAVSSDGEAVITASRGGPTRLWTREQGASPVSVFGYLSPPSVILWPDDREEIIVTGRSGAWCRLPEPGYVAAHPGISETRGQFSHCSEVALDRDGAHMATVDTGGGWVIWSLHRQLPIAAHVTSLDPMKEAALDVLPSGDLVLAGGKEDLLIWELDGTDPRQRECTLRVSVGELAGLGWIGQTPGKELLVSCRDGRVLIFERTTNDEAPWTSREVASIDGTVTTMEHHSAAGVTLVGLESGRLLRAELPDLRDGAFETFVDLPAAVQTIGIGKLAERVGAMTTGQVLYMCDLTGARPRIRWSKRAGQWGLQDMGHTAIAIDEASGWVVTAGVDGVVQTWDVKDGLLGPALATRFGKYADTVFPTSGEGPITVEYRGRINRYERSGAPRNRELDRMEPTPYEAAALEAVTAESRIEFLEQQLERDDLSQRDLHVMESVSSGLAFFARYFPNELDPERAVRADRAVRALRDVADTGQ